MAWAADGSIYVADTNNSRIQHITATGGLLDTITLSYNPVGVALDGVGNIYVSQANTLIDVFSPTGTLIETYDIP
jgi:sugar lactone lactonase YvrE